jgi:hypothetical protein
MEIGGSAIEEIRCWTSGCLKFGHAVFNAPPNLRELRLTDCSISATTLVAWLVGCTKLEHVEIQILQIIGSVRRWKIVFDALRAKDIKLKIVLNFQVHGQQMLLVFDKSEPMTAMRGPKHQCYHVTNVEDAVVSYINENTEWPEIAEEWFSEEGSGWLGGV